MAFVPMGNEGGGTKINTPTTAQNSVTIDLTNLDYKFLALNLYGDNGSTAWTLPLFLSKEQVDAIQTAGGSQGSFRIGYTSWIPSDSNILYVLWGQITKVGSSLTLIARLALKNMETLVRTEYYPNVKVDAWYYK